MPRKLFDATITASPAVAKVTPVCNKLTDAPITCVEYKNEEGGGAGGQASNDSILKLWSGQAELLSERLDKVLMATLHHDELVSALSAVLSGMDAEGKPSPCSVRGACRAFQTEGRAVIPTLEQDVERFTELEAETRKAFRLGDTKRFHEIFQELETIKNRHNGMPPRLPEQAENK